LAQVVKYGSKGEKVGILQRPQFRGWSLNRLDAKGRLRIPTKYREILQNHYTDSLMVTLLDQCLAAYPPENWEKIEAKVHGFSAIDPEQLAFKRRFISSAQECEFDDQGRILIPLYLRNRVGLEQEVVLAGMLENFEIWDKTAWEKQLDWGPEQTRQILEKVAITGL
jgi:MraZ protein